MKYQWTNAVVLISNQVERFFNLTRLVYNLRKSMRAETLGSIISQNAYGNVGYFDNCQDSQKKCARLFAPKERKKLATMLP